MSKADKWNEARGDGMYYAVKRIKEVGLEEFEKELKWRNQVGVYTTIEPEEMRKMHQKVITWIQTRVLIIATLVLHDEFGFGKTKRLKQFMKRYNMKMDGLVDDYVHWDDYGKLFKEITGEDIQLNIA